MRVAVCLSTSLSHLPAYGTQPRGDHWLADLCQLISSRKQAFQQKLLALTQQSYAEKPDNKALKSPIRKLKQAQAPKFGNLTPPTDLSLLAILLVILRGTEYKYYIKNSEKQKMSMFFSVLHSLPCPASSLKFTVEPQGLKAEKPLCPHSGQMDPEDVMLVEINRSQGIASA